ncbi:MAG: deoxyguanosinetriphosphate triphosphohydrolase [Actinobacteria bacterium]|nr:deoxyguanosinetriphosphate triphosphohydrolase [Actinomycetota bacterium]MCA1719767.1 deoxyguanosinetriphosphate triphosphohydrolase [Actinomycetota bacterium]
MPYDDRAAERLVPEPPSGSGRGPFQRDRARVLHSGALRRLAGKTQVVEPSSTSVPRTRLTHSLECAQIGRELGDALGCDPDLVDAACLAHDLGHPPYGHNGETALDEAAAACGGFEGNAQSLRLLTRLEVKVPGAGLNLTRAMLDAATKYPWRRRAGTRKYGVYDDDAEVFGWLRDGAPEGRRPLESQVMDWADDVAYSVHDLEDGVVAGLIDLRELDLQEVAAVAAEHYTSASAEEVAAAFAALLAQPWWPRRYDGTASAQVSLKAATSTLIGRFCRAAEQATRAEYGAALTRYDAGLVVPQQVRLECAALKAVTARYVMDRPGVRLVQEREREVVGGLVALLAGRPEALEPVYAEAWRAAADDGQRLRAVVDQVAGLTDAAAAGLHAQLSRG